MKTILVALFLVGGEPTMLAEDWPVIYLDHTEQCDERTSFIEQYVPLVSEYELFGVYCGPEHETMRQIETIVGKNS